MKNNYDNIKYYFKTNKFLVFLICLSGLLFDGLMCLVPIFQGKLVDMVNDNEPFNKVLKLIALFLLFVLFVQVNRFLKRYTVRLFSNRMVLKMRKVSFNNLIHKNIEVLSKESKGDILNKNLSDIKDSAEGIRKIFTEIFDSFVLIIGYMVVMFYYDIKLSLISIPFFALSILFAQLLKKSIYKATVAYKKHYSYTKGLTINLLSNEIYYRGYGVTDNYYKDYKDTLDVFEKRAKKNTILKNSFEPLYYFIATIGLIFVLYFGGKKVIDDVLTVGSYLAFISTYLLIARKSSKIGKIFNAFTSAKVSWQRCKDFLKPIKPYSNLLINGNNELKVSNLTFGYDETFKLKDISFSAISGEIIGVAGSVRSGKSTLGGALSGLYQYDGSIRVCGIELKDNRDKNINNFIGYCPALTEVFNDSVKFNITFNQDGNLSSSIQDALLEGDINDFNHKEEEILSHSLLNISGGQQRRLQLARALYSNSKLIILDDPFNAIDISMSIEIIKVLKEKYQDKIFVIINNQSETLKMFDHILYLKNNEYKYDTYDNLLKDNDFKKLMGGR